MQSQNPDRLPRPGGQGQCHKGRSCSWLMEPCSQEGHCQTLVHTHPSVPWPPRPSLTELSHAGLVWPKCQVPPGSSQPSPHLGQLEGATSPAQEGEGEGRKKRGQVLVSCSPAVATSGLTPGNHTRDTVPPHAQLAHQAAHPLLPALLWESPQLGLCSAPERGCDPAFERGLSSESSPLACN